MNSGRALILILAVCVVVIGALAVFTFTDSDPTGPYGSGESDEGREREVDDPGAVSTTRVVVTGRVLSRGSGKPVIGAEVTIADAVGKTGRDGRFSLEEVPEGERSVSVRVEGALPLDEKVEIGTEATDVGDLLLPWPTVLTGLVTDVDARPVPGATVRILERMTYGAGAWWRGPSEDQIRFGLEVLDEGKEIPGMRVSTDDQGRYKVEGLSAGNYFVSAARTGHATASKGEVVVPESGEVTADIALGVPSTISGKVLDVGDAGVDGALVMITPWDMAAQVPYRILETTTTTAGGAFRVDSLVEGEKYLVIARAPNGKVGIMIQIPAPREDLVVRVGPRFNLHGVVMDEETGDLIPGARLWTILARGESGEDGRYELNGMVKHVFFKYVWIDAAGYRPAQMELSFLERMGGDIQKDFKLTKKKPSILVVTVRDPNGTPIPGVKLSVRDWSEEKVVGSGTTNDVGEARIEGILSRGVEVTATKEGWIHAYLFTEPSGQQRAYAQEAQWTNLVEGQTATLEVTMVATGAVSGTVHDRQGAPLPGVTISHQAGKLGVTDEKGAFRVDGVPTGLRTLLVFAKAGYVRKTLHVEPDLRDGVDVELARGGTMSGVVVDETGKPVGGVQVRAEREDGGLEIAAKTDADGQFRIEGLEPGEYTITARRGGYAPTRAPGFALAEAQDLEGLSIELVKGHSVSLVVVHPDGTHVNGAIVIYGPLDASKPERILRRVRRQAGEPLVLQLRPGRYQLLASPWGDVEGAGAADLEKRIDASGEVRIELSATVLRLLVKVRAPAGRKLGSVSVQRVEPAEPPVDLWFGVDEDGIVRSVPVPPGKYKLGFWFQPEDGTGAWEHKEYKKLLSPGDKVHEVDLTK